MPHQKQTAGVILAAGMSLRFGQPKQLLELGGKYVLDWVLDAVLAPSSRATRDARDDDGLGVALPRS